MVCTSLLHSVTCSVGMGSSGAYWCLGKHNLMCASAHLALGLLLVDAGRAGVPAQEDSAFAGSGATRSGMPKEAHGAAEQGARCGQTAPGAAPDQPGPAQCFLPSQQSQDARRKRKASFVQDPIRQEPGQAFPGPEPQGAGPERAAPAPAHKVRRSQRATTRRLTAMQA